MANLLVVLEWMEKASAGPSPALERVTDPKKGDLLRWPAGWHRHAAGAAQRGRALLGADGRGLVPAASGLDVDAPAGRRARHAAHCWGPARAQRGRGGGGAAAPAGHPARALDPVLMPYAQRLLAWPTGTGSSGPRAWASARPPRAPGRDRPDAGHGPGRHRPALAGAALREGRTTSVTFLEVEAFRKDVRIRACTATCLARLPGRQQLGAAEARRSHEMALTEAGRPSFTYRLPRVSATSGPADLPVRVPDRALGRAVRHRRLRPARRRAGKVAAYASWPGRLREAGGAPAPRALPPPRRGVASGRNHRDTGKHRGRGGPRVLCDLCASVVIVRCWGAGLW